MIKRGDRWHLKLRIPTDVQSFYEGRSSMFIEQSLKTSDVIAARQLRDAKLKNYQSLWSEMRVRLLREQRPSASKATEYVGDDTLLIEEREEQLDDIPEHISLLWDKIDRLAYPKAPSGGVDELNEAREEVINSPEGSKIWREIQILQGSLTPLEPYCWEWFETKRGKAHKTKIEYRRAISILLSSFTSKEEITQRKARRFLHDLLTANAKATVQKYTTAYRGIWRYHGWKSDADMWSVREMDSAVGTTKVRAVTDDDYLRIMDAIKGTRKRRLWLAIRIAAYSGASRSGICGLKLEGADTDRPSLYLPETKKDWRTRRIPCHPEILEDAAEWVKSPLAPTTLTNEFTEVKQKLGYGRDLVFHSHRHSVANKLENARVSSREIKRLLGHRIGSITFDTYSAEGLGYDVLSEVVGQIVWPKVEW
ncbi:tyrosine-type recombinase/integrase [uncultured Roseovarius sp.]|uniref:tyrosine-type recombinase/integrase n=1 Tax=uncultured Roseovarius sp. TaxID=293344 RepID=UPI0025E20931|nr:tyrosine-type recombinase/integrase [uncultured Roseovarius sp.]